MTPEEVRALSDEALAVAFKEWWARAPRRARGRYSAFKAGFVLAAQHQEEMSDAE